jgi:hypothetical protein
MANTDTTSKGDPDNEEVFSSISLRQKLREQQPAGRTKCPTCGQIIPLQSELAPATASELEQLARDYAADDRKWTTQETVERNLIDFCQKVQELTRKEGA